MLYSLFDTSPTLSAAVTRHYVRRQVSCVKKIREEHFWLVAGCHRRPGHPRGLVQRASTFDATLPLRGSGTCCGSLSPSTTSAGEQRRRGHRVYLHLKQIKYEVPGIMHHEYPGELYILRSIRVQYWPSVGDDSVYTSLRECIAVTRQQFKPWPSLPIELILVVLHPWYTSTQQSSYITSGGKPGGGS